jgi:DNA repair exonuclease SbcCD ATPase subunit
VYQEFDNGTIEVREVEDRGKPGIEFYLIDRKGERTFGQLSAGEKVMFFISIRVAIAQIVAAKKNVQIDYLVLDEAMGNLSEKRRDDLIRVVNKVLRKLFPQVLMVSHTEMRDIFSQTIKVSAENGISILEVA